MGFLVSFSVVIFAKVIENFWLDSASRHADTINGLLQYLYISMFDQESGHRITFLAKPFRYSSYISPRYRFSHGEGNNVKSRSRFRKGSAVAGMAWEQPGEPNLILRKIPDFGDDKEKFLQFLEKDLLLSLKEAERCVETTRNLRWILSYGIVSPFTGEFIGVLSIDSRYEQSLLKLDNKMIVNVAAIIARTVASKNST